MFERVSVLFLAVVLIAGCGGDPTPAVNSADGQRYYELGRVVAAVPDLMNETSDLPDDIFAELSEVRENMAALPPEERQVQEQLDALAVEISNMSPEDSQAIRDNLQKMLELAEANIKQD